MSEAEALARTTRIARNPLVVTASSLDGAMMMHIDQGRYFLIDEIGDDIWNRLIIPCSLANLVDSLARDYAADPATLQRDVEQHIRRLAAEDIVHLG